MKILARLVTLTLAALACLTNGCAGLGYFRCADIPCGAVPQPLGTFSCQWQNTQSGLAEADDFVVYQYEWLDKTAELSPFGRKHIAGLLARLPESQYPLQIEPSGDEALDRHRQAYLINALAQTELVEGFDRVVIGHGMAEPLYGVEAPIVSQGFLFSGSRGGGQSGGNRSGGGNSRGRGLGNAGGIGGLGTGF